MSQKGLLTEAELSEQIQRYIDIKLDKEALMKPTKEMVREVYKRFLDQIIERWMKPKSQGYEPTPTCKMLYWLRVFSRRFNVGIEASMADLTMPTKRRTVILFNLLMYIRALYDEGLERQQQVEKELHEQQDKNALVAREVSKIRAEVEDLAFKIGQARSLEQIRSELEEGYRALRAAKERCDKSEDKKVAIKENLKKEEEMGARLLIDIEEGKKRIEELNRRKDLAYNISDIRKKLEEGESVLQQLKTTNNLKKAEEDHKIRMFELEEREEFERTSEEFKNIQAEIRAVKEAKIEMKRKCEEDIKMTQDTISMAKQALDDLRTSDSAAVEDHEKALKAMLQEYKINLDQLMGSKDESILPDVVKNGTFIKVKKNG